MIDIAETKEVLTFAVSLAVAVDKAIEDGFQWTDVFSLIPPLMKLPEAIEGAELVPTEIEDLDENERAELVAEIERLDFKSEYSEKITEQGLRAGMEIGKLIVLLREAKKI